MKKKIKKIYQFINNLLKNVSKDNVSEYSSQCAYYTILSFIPFLILLLTMIQYTGIGQEALFNAIAKIIPSNMEELVLGIVQEVYSKSLGTISISIIFTLWSAGKGLYALTKGFQKIYKIKSKVKTNYFYLRLIAILQTIVFIFLLVLGLVALVFGGSLISIIKEHFGGLKNFGVLYSILTEILLVIVTFVVFLFIYKFMVRRQVTIKSQIPGAVFGAISLNVISFIFSIYLDIFRGFSITYGSLTTLMLIMMWTYACFYIIFFGAEINKMLEKIREKNAKQLKEAK